MERLALTLPDEEPAASLASSHDSGTADGTYSCVIGAVRVAVAVCVALCVVASLPLRTVVCRGGSTTADFAGGSHAAPGHDDRDGTASTPCGVEA
jgi:hypothetical protein